MAIIGLVFQIVYIGALFFVGYYIIKKAKENGSLKKNMPIIEVTSGNTRNCTSSIRKIL